MTLDMLLGVALAISLWFNISQLTRWQKIKRGLLEGLRRAERRDYRDVRIPINQVLSWGFHSERGVYRDPKEFNQTQQTRHPTSMSPARRQGLRGER
jgi:hypothetical protein